MISSLDAEGLSTIEATEEAQAEWVAWVNTVAELTLFHGVQQLAFGANVPVPQVFMPLPDLSTTRPTVMPSPGGLPRLCAADHVRSDW